MERLDFIECKSNAFDISSSCLELRTQLKLQFCHIVVYFIVAFGLENGGVEESPSEKFFDVVSFDGSDRIAQEPLLYVPFVVLGAPLAELEKFTALLF